MKTYKIKIWELSLAIGVFCAIIFGLWAQDTQDELSEQLVRLHVVANSDSEADQTLKLKVRDRTLNAAAPLLESADSAEAAAAILAENLRYLEMVAGEEIAKNGYDYPVRATVAEEDFPTRDYDGFSLPAGRYEALRLTIGDGAGRNWWCVVLPPLCDAASRGSIAGAGLSDRGVALISDGGKTKVKFKCVELWSKFRQKFSKKT
jgi:stage II sporulation protein R